MKLKGLFSHLCVDDDETEEKTEDSDVSASSETERIIVVGYVLTSKKKKSFLQPNFIRLARIKGIDFVPIDPKIPISEQGQIDIILHKLATAEWSQAIQEYRNIHPEAIVVDPPDAIRHLYNRQSMLEVVGDLKLPESYGKICIPRQLVISEYLSSVPDEVKKAGLRYPLVAKPLVVDGSSKSHELFLAYDHVSLLELEAPMVLQEFVNHGGILFKVFIVGETTRVVKRSSLPNVTKSDISKISGVFRFPRISRAEASAADYSDLDPCVTELPARPLLEMVAREISRRLGLRLFNMDMIRQSGTKDVYYIIDINYFPGYGKLPEYEDIFTDFILGCQQNEALLPSLSAAVRCFSSLSSIALVAFSPSAFAALEFVALSWIWNW
ncbi:hypothetical protein M569_01552 [Genlisea aurea]|uniref:Inositol-tetrakisphosphate 1-kinase n=1 Tax=Genlisea aurea TaxID=192259 RepID=S8EKQ0_9LAMI|nr:hypothetical protein M569_01552 [Genlisea aurea]